MSGGLPTNSSWDFKDSMLAKKPAAIVAYRTPRGAMLHGKSEQALESNYLNKCKGRVNLIFTSPPYPLNRKKKYGNLKGEEYIDWICSFGELYKSMLTRDGSIVMEIGNSWEAGSPTMSTLATRALLEFLERNNLYLCQEFVWNNPAKLPSPVQWVNVERTRVKDSFTKLWWMSPVENPKANNRNVLVEYSKSMKGLLKRGSYNSGSRPSEHHIGAKSFLTNHGGAISGSVLTYPNTSSDDKYHSYCRDKGIRPHPARMPANLAEFFIKFLTDENDTVMDPFGGSNTTGYVAQSLNRNWISIEPNMEYIASSTSRFPDAKLTSNFERKVLFA